MLRLVIEGRGGRDDFHANALNWLPFFAHPGTNALRLEWDVWGVERMWSFH